MSAPGMGSSILLVSDFPLVFADLANILKTDPDLDVRLVPDTDTAAERIAAEKPHLIICRCSAFEALSQVCEEREGDDTGGPAPFLFSFFSRGQTHGRSPQPSSGGPMTISKSPFADRPSFPSFVRSSTGEGCGRNCGERRKGSPRRTSF